MKNQLLQVLTYFDLFNHPLSEEELVWICGGQQIKKELMFGIQEAIMENRVFTKNEHYGIQPDIEKQLKIRKHKEELAQAYFKKLPRYVRIIRSFPFVRAIAISGSLSKKVMHDDGDIDYFIITKKNRLWICRSMLILFKKIFLLNSKKYFCINYFVDENNLEIRDKNMFTAIEISHLLPVYNRKLLLELYRKNKWVSDIFPGVEYRNEPLGERHSSSFMKKIIERFFDVKLWDYLDLYLMKVTHQHWSKKFKTFDASKLELTMRSNRGVSKHHPRDFQNRVLSKYKENLKKVGLTHEDITYA